MMTSMQLFANIQTSVMEMVGQCQTVRMEPWEPWDCHTGWCVPIKQCVYTPLRDQKVHTHTHTQFGHTV